LVEQLTLELKARDKRIAELEAVIEKQSVKSD
jgi:hypothetical protein